ncbi:MAG: hypothetical protein JSS02_29190 [Planctomycetes bacterium]|nr:hypothetical protein [Planctomycetota bacterium]
MLADQCQYWLMRFQKRCGLWPRRVWLAGSAGLLLALVPGCSMYKSGFYNLFIAPCQFHIHKDQDRTEAYHRRVAQEALAEMCQANPEMELTKDYQSGFEDGVVQYLTYGGNELPPLAPPRKYWKLKYHNPEGQQAAQEWLAGCADGRIYAAQSGMRPLATVSNSAWGIAPANPYYGEVTRPTGTTAPMVPAGISPEPIAPRYDPQVEETPLLAPEPASPELPREAVLGSSQEPAVPGR